MHPPPERMAAIADGFVDTLAELHAVDFEAAGLGELGRPDGYVRRQVDGWAGRYEKARTDDVPEMTRVAAWLDANARPESDAVLIHNDEVVASVADDAVIDALGAGAPGGAFNGLKDDNLKFTTPFNGLAVSRRTEL